MNSEPGLKGLIYTQKRIKDVLNGGVIFAFGCFFIFILLYFLHKMFYALEKTPFLSTHILYMYIYTCIRAHFIGSSFFPYAVNTGLCLRDGLLSLLHPVDLIDPYSMEKRLVCMVACIWNCIPWCFWTHWYLQCWRLVVWCCEPNSIPKEHRENNMCGFIMIKADNLQ